MSPPGQMTISDWSRQSPSDHPRSLIPSPFPFPFTDLWHLDLMPRISTIRAQR